MKFYLKGVLTALLFLFAYTGVFGQELLWNVDLNYRFDNREYKSFKISESRTLFGSRLTPQLGIAWNNQNSLMMGVNMMSDFGQKTFYTTPDFFAYYNFDNDRFDFTAGVFPRDKIIGDYSNAFFSDSLRFYDVNLEGMIMHWKRKNFYFEIGCDWNSMYSADKREKFMLFSAAQYKPGVFYLGYSFDMYHHAGSYTNEGVVDNVLVSPYVGLDFAEKTSLSKFKFQAAWLQGFQNDRNFVGEYVFPSGMQLDFLMEYKQFGVSNNLYLGDNLFPYYDSPYEDGQGTTYSYHLYNGDPYYKTTSGVYNRLEFYWEPTLIKELKARISSIHHYDGRNWGWQQVISLRFNIGDRLFGKK